MVSTMSEMMELIKARPDLPTPKELCWLEKADDCEDEEDYDEEDYCPECAEKSVQEGWDINYSMGMAEADGTKICGKCDSLLSITLTDYGVESELEHFEMYGIHTPRDWAVLLMIMESVFYQYDYSGREVVCLRQYKRTCNLFNKYWK
jgi:hypothetical protein